MENSTKNNAWTQTQTTPPPPATPNFLLSVIYFLLKGPFNLLLAIYHHLAFFFCYVDLTQDCASKAVIRQVLANTQSLSQRIRANAHHLGPFILLSINLVDSGILLAEEGFRYNRTGIEGLITHNIFPQDFWYPGSVIMHLTIVMSIIVPGLFLFKPGLEAKYLIFVYHYGKSGSAKVIQGGKAWKKNDSERFIKYRTSTRNAVFWIQATVICITTTYWGFSLYFLNNKNNLRSYIFFVWFPFFDVYTIFGCVYIVFSIMMSANYTRVQQNFLVERITTMTAEICNGRQLTKRQSSETIWRRFTAINNEILHFGDQQRALNRFWSPYLSVYFALHISMEVFLMYAGLFNGGEFNIVLRSIFIYFTVELMCLLIAITGACTAVVRHNIKIYKSNVAFCYAYTRKYEVKALYQLKMSKMIANYRGTRNGFRLINNYIVDSRMFEIIFFYISVIGMKVLTER